MPKSVLVSILQKNRANRISINPCIQTYFYMCNIYTEGERESKIERDAEKLAHIVMESETSYHLLSSKWRIRKANDVIPV